MRYISHAVGITLALAAGPVLAGSMEPAAASNSWRHEGLERTDAANMPWGRHLDSASSAQPSAARPEARDASQDFVRVTGPAAKADAMATASASCDGCSGEATTVQVVSFDGGRSAAAADNIASAWATCSSCSASAVSVQIILVPRRGTIEANNRSLAVNASCDSCSTAAAALQFVLAGAPRRQLSAAATELVSQARTALAERLEPASRRIDARRAKADARTAAEETARRLEQIVTDDLGGGEIQRSLDVQVGS